MSAKPCETIVKAKFQPFQKLIVDFRLKTIVLSLNRRKVCGNISVKLSVVTKHDSLIGREVMDKYIVETEATILEIDGRKLAIVLLSPNYGSPEAKTLVSDEVWRLLGEYDNLLTGMWHSDGKLGIVASPELEEKIRAKISPDHKWTKVRIYPPPESVQDFPDNS